MAEQEKKNPAEKPAKAKKPSIFARIGKWFHELKSECKKIVWPTRKQTINNTAVVIASVVIVGVFVWVLDGIFKIGVSAIIS